ncbi:MAG: hypothetical protein KatS3mg108_3664 [Isosphaeraceae bacterium]|jgi:hypothetical protein|nr:MAG: hypothetical protein KatS3mg108_3664 [Isosphaeraceae bacterium]
MVSRSRTQCDRRLAATLILSIGIGLIGLPPATGAACHSHHQAADRPDRAGHLDRLPTHTLGLALAIDAESAELEETEFDQSIVLPDSTSRTLGDRALSLDQPLSQRARLNTGAICPVPLRC